MSADDPLPIPGYGTIAASSAILSDDRHYRYVLYRRWQDHGNPAVFVMLNPSTADEFVDDPTIRRCIGFAQSWGCTSLVVVNLYAYRATKPTDLAKADDPVGPDNDQWLRREFGIAAALDAPLVAAWGVHGRGPRVAEVMALPGAERFQCFGTTKDGAPRHPLYLSSHTPLMPWRP